MLDQAAGTSPAFTLVGIALGMPMPLGLARFSALYPRSVAYAWGVNGIASVLASVLGIVVAINSGYRVASLVAGGCYGLGLLHAAVGRWATSRSGGPATEPPPEPELDEREMVPA